MTVLDRDVVVSALVVCVVCLAVVGLSGAAAAQTTETANETTNETVQHERPDSASESGDATKLQRWLGNRLSDQLGSSTVALSEGEYERARELLGEDYDGRLDQYVTVASDIEDEGDTGDTYREVRDSQRTLVNQAQQFEAASERYERARENGNTTAARQAAREMDRLGDRISDTGSNTTTGYRSLENQTGTDTSEERTIVNGLVANVSARQAAARNATFVETELAVLEATRDISFVDPLELTGRLTTVNGSEVRNRTVRIEVAGRPRSVTTDANGRFTLSYRPRTLRVDASTVAVAYVPRNESVYLGTGESVPVTVDQVEPELRVRNHTARTGFGQPVGASAVLSVDGEPVGDVPLVAEIDTFRFGRSATTETGTARIMARLPATPAAGDYQLRVAAPLENRAIAPADAAVTVSIASTETTLNATGDRRGSEATVTGRLVTTEGRPVPNQVVQLTRNDSGLTTVETGPDGNYSATIPLSSGDGAVTGPVRVAVTFDGAGTNLEPARASTVIVTAGEQGGTGSPWPALPADGVLVAVAGVLVGLSVGAWAVRRRRSADDGGDRPGQSPPAATGSTATAAADSRSAIERAEAFLEQGAVGAAVRAAYAATRERFEPADSVQTPHELQATVQSLDEDQRTAFDRVTTAYEREVFAPGTVEERRARAAVDAAGELVDGVR